VDWAFAKGSMIFSPVKGKPPSELVDQQRPGYLPYVSNEYLRENKAIYAKPGPNTALTKENDIILLWDGSNAGEVFLAKPGILSSTMSLLEIKDKNKFDKKYIYYSLKAKEVALQRTTKGTGVPHVDGQLLSVLPFAVPSLKEQEKIAEVLYSVDEAIGKTQKIIDQTQTLKKGLMQILFTRGLPGKHKKLKKIGIGELPAEWKIVRLADCGQWGSGGTPSRKNLKAFNGDVPWVKSGEVSYCVITDTEEKITLKAAESISGAILPIDTLLVAMYGQGVTRGKVAILGVPACVNQAVAWFQGNKDAETKYFYYWFEENYSRIRKIAAGSNQDNLNGKQLKNLRIARPDIIEQEKIAEILWEMDKKISTDTKMAQEYLGLKSALMQVLLSGKVRVGRCDNMEAK